MSSKYFKNIGRALLLAVLLAGAIPAQAQSLYDRVYSRAQRMSPVEPQARSPRMNHLWMAYLADSLQPSVLVDLAHADASVAADYLSRAFRESGHDREIGMQLMMVAGVTQEWDLLRQTKDELLRQKPDDKRVLYLLMRLYLENRETDRAIDVLKELQAMDKSNSEYMYRLSTMLIENGRPDEAESVLREYLREQPNELTASRILVVLLLQGDRVDEAGEVVDSLLRRHPNNPRALEIQILLFSESEPVQKAVEVLRDYSQTQGCTAEELEGLTRAVEGYYDDLSGVKQALMPLAKQLAEKYPDSDFFQSYALEYYLATSDTDHARQEATRLIEEGAKARSAYEYMIRDYVAGEKEDSIAYVAKQGLLAYPNDAQFLLYDLISFAQDHPDDQAALLEKVDHALEVVPEESNLYMQFMAIKADALEQMGNWPEARKYYEQVIRSGNVSGTNNFAYFLTKYSDDPEDLLLAEKLAASVVKEYPDEPTYLDTYAWVLYKRRAYTLAKVYMERALEKSEEPAVEYYRHYAHILKALKDYDAAIDAWRKALENGADAEEVCAEVLEIEELKSNKE